MPHYICLWCNAPNGVRFHAKEPVCPHCQRRGAKIRPTRIVHWMQPNPRGLILGFEENYFVACMKLRPHTNGIMATGDMGHVSCEDCRATQAFKDAWRLWCNQFPDLAQEWEERKVLLTS